MKTLKSKQKKYLKSLIDKDITTVQLGKEGISDKVQKHINEVLEHKELIRINVLDADSFPVKETATEISNILDANIIRVIGKKILLYRESTELKNDEKIQLPI